RAAAVIGKNDPITAMAIPPDDGDGAAINVHHASAAQPHAAGLFLGEPRRAAATAITARAIPAVAAAVITVPAAMLYKNAEFRTAGGCRGSSGGEAGKRDQSRQSGLDENIGHGCLSRKGQNLAPLMSPVLRD